MLKKGLIQVYTGSGKQTNFAPVGLSLRAAGHKLRTHMTFFLRHEWMDAADLVSGLLKPYLVIDHAGAEDSPPNGKWNKAPINKMRRALKRSQEVLHGGKFDIVVLNGVNEICSQGIITFDDVLALMREKPDNVELVLTGPGANDEIIERADLVTEMVYHAKRERPQKGNEPRIIAPTEVITGNGKGKTTYCLGKAMIMSSLGTQSTILQFIKSPRAYGEVKAIERLPHLEIKTMGEGFLDTHTAVPNEKHLRTAKRAWEECLKEVFSLQYGLIVMDEINIATHYGLVSADRVREMLFLKPEKLHLILSGRNAHSEVMESASTVIEMREIKHPFKAGIKARKGIEF
jgi:cob(I)alamin adenosyltransferase